MAPPDFPLRAHERILWQGRPQQHCGVRPWLGFYLGAIIPGALLLWGFTEAVPQGAAEGFHEWASHFFCRLVLGILTLAFGAAPTLAAWSTNGSDYSITNQRISIRKPGLRGARHTDDYEYARISTARVRPMNNGLANLHFSGSNSTPGSERTSELLYAIPRLVAEDVQKLIERNGNE